MTDDTDPAADARVTAAYQRFDNAFAEWLAARADIAIGHDDRDNGERKRANRERGAELALIATPAPHSNAVWQKWELLDQALTLEADTGPLDYPLPVLAAAALMADIMRLGLKPWPGP